MYTITKRFVHLCVVKIYLYYIMEEHILIDKLKKGNKNAFSLLFTAYYKDIVLFGRSFIHEREACEDIVQTVFLKLWDDYI